MLQFNFAEWLEIQEAVIQKDGEGKPFKLDLYFPNGELNPPVCRRTGIHFQGRGLICFDFDQTLTTAYFGHPKNPADKASHSTANPNPVMLKKMEQHKHAGNKVVIVTARGEKEGQLTGSPVHYAGLQPIITNDKTIGNPYGQRRRDFDPTIKNDPRWGAITRSLDGPQHAYHLGAVRDSNPRHQQRQCCALPAELTARTPLALSAKTANRLKFLHRPTKTANRTKHPRSWRRIEDLNL